MNKNQLIIAWVMGILISLCFVVAPYLNLIDDYARYGQSMRVHMYYFQTTAPLLILGGLLIYTLRDKKK